MKRSAGLPHLRDAQQEREAERHREHVDHDPELEGVDREVHDEAGQAERGAGRRMFSGPKR